jgi:hemolysin activation/secretion protein
MVVYASRSTTDTGTRLGPVTTITDTATLHVFTQDASHSPTVTENAGTKFVFPLPQLRGLQSSLTAGIDIKYYSIHNLTTNLFTVQQFDITDPNNPVLILSDTVPEPSQSRNTLTYLPLSIGWSGSRPDSQGSFSFNYNQSLFLTPLAHARTNFQTVANSPKAGGNYTTINAGLIRQQNLPGNWSAIFNANGQWASEPVINNEQFTIGGTSGVRGYQEGEAYGDTGWRTLFDLRAPPIQVGNFSTAKGDVPANLRVSWFMDYGQVYLLDRPSHFSHELSEWGTGLGFYLTASEHFDARLTLAWALLNASSSSNPTQTSVVTAAGDCQVYFSVGYQF